MLERQEGGQLIYSTCTFNPMEDEAVVAEVRHLQITGKCSSGVAGPWHEADMMAEPRFGIMPNLDRTCGKAVSGMSQAGMQWTDVCLTRWVLIDQSPHAITQILRRTRGSIELVDASELLPGLKRTPGLRRWRPFDKQKQAFFDTHDEARAVRMSSDSCSAALCAHLNNSTIRLHILFSYTWRHVIDNIEWAYPR